MPVALIVSFFHPGERVHRISRWLFLAVPILGVLELVLQLGQSNRHVAKDDWSRVRDQLHAMIRPDDLLAIAPSFVDPIGRQNLGEGLITLERAARADESRFARLLEVSILDAHLGEFAGWPIIEHSRIGAITLTSRRNPAYERVLDDLVTHFQAEDMSVSQVIADTEVPCLRTRATPLSGNLGFGPAVPADRFACKGSMVGITVLADLDYQPRRCLLTPPIGGDAVLRLRFPNVKFGRVLRGHHAIGVYQERERDGVPVMLVFQAQGRMLGRFMHVDGDGWKPFAMDTGELAGQTGELLVEVFASTADKRKYCFEATTR